MTQHSTVLVFSLDTRFKHNTAWSNLCQHVSYTFFLLFKKKFSDKWLN